VSGASRWERTREIAKRTARAGFKTGRGVIARGFKSQMEMAKVALRHPEILAGKVSPELIQDVIKSGIGASTPAQAVAAIKEFRANYAQQSISAFGEMFADSTDEEGSLRALRILLMEGWQQLYAHAQGNPKDRARLRMRMWMLQTEVNDRNYRQAVLTYCDMVAQGYIRPPTK